jgi:hypothetical protein
MTDRDEGAGRIDPKDRRQAGAVRAYGWQWGPYDTRRPGLPWIGVFLVVLGALLLLDRLVPQYHLAGSAFALAIGLAFLLRWAIARDTGSLYAGAIITALALPDILEGFGLVAGPGLGTFCLGLAFLFIAFVRWAGRGSVGWQAWVGTILALYGLTRLAIPDLGGVIVPAVLVAMGVVLLVRGSARR